MNPQKEAYSAVPGGVCRWRERQLHRTAPRCCKSARTHHALFRQQQTAETSEHSVVVYIDNAKETPVLLLVVVIGFGSMIMLCMGFIFIAYRLVKRATRKLLLRNNGTNVLPATLKTRQAKKEVNGLPSRV